MTHLKRTLMRKVVSLGFTSTVNCCSNFVFYDFKRWINTAQSNDTPKTDMYKPKYVQTYLQKYAVKHFLMSVDRQRVTSITTVNQH